VTQRRIFTGKSLISRHFMRVSARFLTGLSAIKAGTRHDMAANTGVSPSRPGSEQTKGRAGDETYRLDGTPADVSNAARGGRRLTAALTIRPADAAGGSSPVPLFDLHSQGTPALLPYSSIKSIGYKIKKFTNEINDFQA
jgi:hypothetical protein